MPAPPDPQQPLQRPPLRAKYPLGVFIADDHPIVRSGIRDELARHAEVEMLGEATIAEALQAAA